MTFFDWQVGKICSEKPKDRPFFVAIATSFWERLPRSKIRKIMKNLSFIQMALYGLFEIKTEISTQKLTPIPKIPVLRPRYHKYGKKSYMTSKWLRHKWRSWARECSWDFVHYYPCTKFHCSRFTNNWIKEGAEFHPPPPPVVHETERAP